MRIHCHAPSSMIFFIVMFLGIEATFCQEIAREIDQQQVTQDVEAEELKQEPLHQEVPIKALSLTPQFPLWLIAFDGVTYVYHSDCCEDGDVGKILSDHEMSPLGCKKTEVNGGNAMALPGSTFGHSPPNQEPSLVLSTAFDSHDAAEPYGDPVFYNYPGEINVSLTDYYGGGSFRDTVVELTDDQATPNVRFYTLARMQVSGNTDNGSGGTRGFQYDYPVLIISRLSPDWDVKLASGAVVTYTPANLPLGAAVSGINLANYHYGMVTIQLPDPVSSNPTAVDCLLINRKH